MVAAARTVEVPQAVHRGVIARFLHDPQSVLDYLLDYSANLFEAGETIYEVTWAADTGITIDSSENTPQGATVWISGGTVGEVYQATATVVTSDQRTYEHTIELIVEQA